MSTVTPARTPSPRPPLSRRPVAAPRAASIDPFRILRRHLVAIVLSVVAGTVLGAAAYVLLDQTYPLYTGEVLLEVQPGVQKAGDVSSRDPLRDEHIHQIAMTQLVLLTSRDVLKSAMNDVDVQQNTNWFRENFTEGGTPLVEEAVDELEEDLRTSVVRDTQLFRVAWSTHHAKDVPIVLNSIQKAYLARRKEIDESVHLQNRRHFTRQLDATNLEINDLEEQIARFIRDAGITSLDDPRYHQAALQVQELTEAKGEAGSKFSMARTNYLQIAAKIEGTMEYTSEDVLEAEMDYAVAGYINTEQELRLALRDTREKYPISHPQAIAAEARLRSVQEERKEALEEIIRRNLNARLKQHANEVERLGKLLEQLEEELEKKDALLVELAAKQSQYDALKRRRENFEKSRDDDLHLLKEVELMRLREDARRVRLAEAAQTPRAKSFPKPEVIGPLGVLASLALTLGFIFLRELTNQRVRTASDLQMLPGARVLGVVPDVTEDPTRCEAAELVVRRFPHSVLAESYRQAATPLSKAIDEAGHRAVVVMGGSPGAGTTTAVSNLAVGCALGGRRVVVVDANFRRPRLAAVMGVDADRPGLGDVLAGQASLPDVIVETDAGVSVIGPGTPANRIIERLNTDRLDAMVAELRSRYDLVMFDVPPAVAAGDALVVATKLDGAVLIVRANREARGLVSRLIGQIADTQCELLGIVLNRPRGTAGGYFKKNFATMAEYAQPVASEP